MDTAGIKLYSGECLKLYTDTVLEGIREERDFVGRLKQYLAGRINRVYAVSGLRGTGKTVGLLQAVRSLSQYNSTAYILVSSECKVSCSDLRRVIEQVSGIDYIFIDEITYVENLYTGSAFLSDALCNMGKKVVISGTDSLALVKSEESALYHRVIMDNVTHIKYSEAERTAGLTLREYVEMGGLYRSDSINGIEGLRRYIDTAVVNNIMNTLTKNSEITSLLNISSISRERLRLIVFKIIYAVIYLSTQKESAVSVNMLVNLFDYSGTEYNSRLLNDIVCEQMNIDGTVIPNKSEIICVLDAMCSIGILVRIQNLANSGQFQYYITNPSIVNQLLYAIVSIISDEELALNGRASVKGVNGKVFESIVVCHIKEIADKYGYGTYFYHDKHGREADIVIRKENMDEFGDNNQYIVYEVKMTDDSDTAVLKSRWINDMGMLDSIACDGEIVRNAVIYRGTTKKFSGFEKDNLLPPRGSTLAETEEKNMGVELFNIKELLLNTEKFIH